MGQHKATGRKLDEIVEFIDRVQGEEGKTPRPGRIAAYAGIASVMWPYYRDKLVEAGRIRVKKARPLDVHINYLHRDNAACLPPRDDTLELDSDWLVQSAPLASILSHHSTDTLVGELVSRGYAVTLARGST